MRLVITLAAVVQAAAVSAADPVIVLDVAGLSYDDVAAVSRRLTPPDSMGCVGPNEFVEFINGAYAISTKQGVRQSLMSDTQFWLNAGLDSGVLAAGISDPRITFDPTVNRWFASEITVSASSSQVLVARSDTADPGGGWRGLHFTGSPGALADYDTLAVDATNVYLGTNNFVRTDGTWVFQDVTLNVIPKADLLADTLSLAGLKQFADATLAIGSTPRGVTNYSTAPGHGVAFAVSGTSWQESERTTVLGSGTAATLAPTVAIPTQYDVADGPVPIVQSGSTALDVLDNRYSADVIQVGDVIYATNTVINGTRDAVHWIAVSESTNAVLGEGLIADPDYDFWQPSIGVNPSGTFLLAFNSASDTAPDGNVGIWGAVGTTTGTSLAVAGAVRAPQRHGGGLRWARLRYQRRQALGRLLRGIGRSPRPRPVLDGPGDPIVCRCLGHAGDRRDRSRALLGRAVRRSRHRRMSREFQAAGGGLTGRFTSPRHPRESRRLSTVSRGTVSDEIELRVLGKT